MRSHVQASALSCVSVHVNKCVYTTGPSQGPTLPSVAQLFNTSAAQLWLHNRRMPTLQHTVAAGSPVRVGRIARILPGSTLRGFIKAFETSKASLCALNSDIPVTTRLDDDLSLVTDRSELCAGPLIDAPRHLHPPADMHRREPGIVTYPYPSIGHGTALTTSNIARHGATRCSHVKAGPRVSPCR